MYRNQFIKKPNNFKTIKPVSAVPTVKPATVKPKSRSNISPARMHSNSIGTSHMRSLNYDQEGNIIVSLYDNIDFQSSGSMPIDYVLKSEEQDTDVSVGFDKCLLLPLYHPENQSASIVQPHLDELQNMYQWLVMSKEMEKTDPESSNNNHIYPLVISQETKSIIVNTTEQEISHDISVLPSALFSDLGEKPYTGEVYTVGGKKYPVVWLGYYIQKDVEGTPTYESNFLKCYLKNVEIGKLYTGNGSVDQNGKYTKTVTEIPVGIAMTFNAQGTDLQVNILSGSSVDSTYNLNGGEFSEASKYPVIPGYQTYLNPTEPRDGKQEIQERPIINTAVQSKAVAKSENGTITGLSQEMICDLTGLTAKQTITGLSYPVDRSGKRVMDKPEISLIYAWTEEEDVTGTEETGYVLKQRASKKICELINTIKNCYIKGAITVYQKEPGEGEAWETVKKAQLRYLSNLTLEDCKLVDQTTGTMTIEYFWLYNVQMNNCDNQMKYYKIYDGQGFQVIGDTTDYDIHVVGRDGEGIRKVPNIKKNTLGGIQEKGEKRIWFVF